MTEWFDLSGDEERAVAAFMQRVAALPGPTTLRDPIQIWWKAQLLRRWDAERRAQAPLDAMERVEILAGMAAAAVLLTWAVPSLVRFVAEPLRQLLG